MATVTVYFDCSDGGPSDPDGVWTNDSNAFNGSLSNAATSSADGTTSVGYLKGDGTNATDLGGTITQVRARHYDSNGSSSSGLARQAYIYTDGLAESLGNTSRDAASTAGYSSYTTLSTPSGGWTWSKIQALETKIISSGADTVTASIYIVELEVTYTPPTGGTLTGVSTMTGVSTITF